jgi:hypothetical protein
MSCVRCSRKSSRRRTFRRVVEEMPGNRSWESAGEFGAFGALRLRRSSMPGRTGHRTVRQEARLPVDPQACARAVADARGGSCSVRVASGQVGRTGPAMDAHPQALQVRCRSCRWGSCRTLGPSSVKAPDLWVVGQFESANVILVRSKSAMADLTTSRAVASLNPSGYETQVARTPSEPVSEWRHSRCGWRWSRSVCSSSCVGASAWSIWSGSFGIPRWSHTGRRKPRYDLRRG